MYKIFLKKIRDFAIDQKCIPWQFSKKIKKYVYRVDGQIIRDYSEFSGVAVKEIRGNIANFHSLANKEWDSIPESSYKNKADIFYELSNSYIYDLLSVNYKKDNVVKKINKFNPLIMKHIKSHPGKKFLEFGGGLGIFCEIVTKMTKEVTYLDIPGLVSDFAIWRFKKYNLPIKIIINDPHAQVKLSDSYDIIFSDAVLEHVDDPEDKVDILCKHLSENGLLILLVHLDNSGDFYMHNNINIYNVHMAIKKNGLFNICGENTFCSIWKKRSS